MLCEKASTFNSAEREREERERERGGGGRGVKGDQNQNPALKKPLCNGKVLIFASVYQRSRKAIILLTPAYFLIKRLIFSIKSSCKDGHLLIATNWCLILSAGRQGLSLKSKTSFFY